jgi:drug/metabolite transporter (DMT)-like permease
VEQSKTNADAWKGIGLMVLGSALVIGCDALSKILTEIYPVEQVLGLRQLIAIVPLVTFASFFGGIRRLKPVNAKGQLIRGILFCVATWLVILSLKYLPLPTVNSIGFSAPILVAALSMASLKEQVGIARWIAIMFGFIGVLLIVRPGTASFTWALLLPVSLALCNGVRDIYTRGLTKTETSVNILFWSSIIVLLVSLPSAPFTWKALDRPGASIFILSGLLYAAAHVIMIEAFRFGRAAAISSYRYSALIWSMLFAYLIWDHLPSIFVFIGMALIAGGSIFMLRQEVRHSG